MEIEIKERVRIEEQEREKVRKNIAKESMTIYSQTLVSSFSFCQL